MRLVSALLLCAACGGGPQLTNLRCRTAQCQDVEDPLKLLLEVDFSDDSGTLGMGVLDLRLGGATQSTVSISDMFTAQGIPQGTKKGTLAIDDDMMIDKLSQGEAVTVSVVAVNGQGKQSNEPELTFTLHLGGP